MDKKIKHRILGILAIIGLIIIFLPLFQNQNIQPETKLVKAPPFPNPITHSPAENQSTLKQTETKSIENKEVVSQQSDDVINALPAEEKNVSSRGREAFGRDDAAGIKSELARPAKNAGLPMNASFDTKHTIITGSTLTLPLKSKMKTPSTSLVDTAINHDNLIGTKNIAWAIQIGSFKDKKNALRLVNQLRGHGYRAFMRQISTTFGENTRVYVGPELKRVLARELAVQIERDVHIKGMIVRYQPLSL
jgi:DedD protein